MDTRTIRRSMTIFAGLVVLLVAGLIGGRYLLSFDIPIPFLSETRLDGEEYGMNWGSVIVGSVVKIGRKNITDVYKVAFPAGVDSEEMVQERIYLVTVPDDPAIVSVPLDEAVSLSGSTAVNYFGYKYTTSDAAEEKLHKADPLFADRFPGQFFASQKARDEDSLYGNGLALFESNNGIIMAATTGATAIHLERNSLYVFVVNETSAARITVRSAPLCGNGTPDGTEQCDDGNEINTDACTDACTDAVCGDTFTQPLGADNQTGGGDDEECDDGNTVDTDACRNNCTFQPANPCGNGTPDGTEQCDDGNEINTDACTDACTDAVCGDTFTQPLGADNQTGGGDDEQCDDGNLVNTDSCINTCEHAVCGDLFTQPLGADNQTGGGDDEQCDDGNTDDTDGCRNDCTFPAVDVTPLTVVVLPLASENTAVSGQQDLTLFQFRADAGANELLLKMAMFAAADGALGDLENYELWSDTTGDGVVDGKVLDGELYTSDILRFFDAAEAADRHIPAAGSTVFEVRADVPATAGTSDFRLAFKTDLINYLGAAVVATGTDLSTIETDGISFGPAEIVVTTASATVTLWHLNP